MNTPIKPAAQNLLIENFPIEDGIPMPGKAAKYPFNQMKVGQSFFVAEAACAAKNVRACVSNFQKTKKGWKFTTSVVETPLKGVRVWLAELPKEEAKTD